MYIKILINRTYLYLVFILLFCFTIIASAASLSDTLTFVHITDTHICNLESYHPVIANKRQHYGNGVEPLTHFFRTVPRQNDADAVILTGDIIDFYEAEYGNGNMFAFQVEPFSQLYDICPVPLFMTLGNHDIASYWVNENDEIQYHSQNNSQKARATWIRNVPCFNNGTYYARSYNVGTKAYRFIFLDDGYYLKDDKIGNLWDTPQINWLNDQLTKNSNESAILFMHIPIPVGDTNGDGNTFPLPPDGWPEKDTYESGIMKVLNDHSNIAAIFVGHNHKNVIEDIPFPQGRKITQIETGAFGRDPNNWRLIKLTENGIDISSAGGLKIEANIEITNK